MVNSKRFLTPKKRGGAKGSHKRMRGGDVESPAVGDIVTRNGSFYVIKNIDENNAVTLTSGETDEEIQASFGLKDIKVNFSDPRTPQQIPESVLTKSAAVKSAAAASSPSENSPQAVPSSLTSARVMVNIQDLKDESFMTTLKQLAKGDKNKDGLNKTEFDTLESYQVLPDSFFVTLKISDSDRSNGHSFEILKDMTKSYNLALIKKKNGEELIDINGLITMLESMTVVPSREVGQAEAAAAAKQKAAAAAKQEAPESPLPPAPPPDTLEKCFQAANNPNSQTEDQDLDETELTEYFKKPDNLQNFLKVLLNRKVHIDGVPAHDATEDIGKLVNALITSFDADGNQQLNLQELTAGQQLLREKLNKEIPVQKVTPKQLQNISSPSSEGTFASGFYTNDPPQKDSWVEGKILPLAFGENWELLSTPFYQFVRNDEQNIECPKEPSEIKALIKKRFDAVANILGMDRSITAKTKIIVDETNKHFTLNWDGVHQQYFQTKYQDVASESIGLDGEKFKVNKDPSGYFYVLTSQKGPTLEGDSSTTPTLVRVTDTATLKGIGDTPAGKKLSYLNFRNLIGNYFDYSYTQNQTEYGQLLEFLTQTTTNHQQIVKGKVVSDFDFLVQSTISDTLSEESKKKIKVNPKQFYSIFEKKLAEKMEPSGVVFPPSFNKSKYHELKEEILEIGIKKFTPETGEAPKSIPKGTLITNINAELTEDSYKELVKFFTDRGLNSEDIRSYVKDTLDEADVDGDGNLTKEELTALKKLVTNPLISQLHDLIRVVGLLICQAARSGTSQGSLSKLASSFTPFSRFARTKGADTEFKLNDLSKRFGQALIILYYLLVHGDANIVTQFKQRYINDAYSRNMCLAEIIPGIFGNQTTAFQDGDLTKAFTNNTLENLKGIFDRTFAVFSIFTLAADGGQESKRKFFQLFSGLAFYRLCGQMKSGSFGDPKPKLSEVHKQMGDSLDRIETKMIGDVDEQTRKFLTATLLEKYKDPDNMNLQLLNHLTTPPEGKDTLGEHTLGEHSKKKYNNLEPLFGTKYNSYTTCVNKPNKDKRFTGGKNSKKRRSQVVNSKKRQSTSQQKQTPKRKTAQQQSKTKSKSPQQQQKQQQKKQQQKQSQQKKNTQAQKKSSKNGKK